jgi:hypothetical protein
VPQIPKLDALGIYMKESKDGDYFEIYATYDNSFETFAIFMDDSKKINKFYYLEFDITVFEENIKGKTQTYKIENDFTEIVEYRPIIKYSTTNAIIDVEMRLINRDDGNVVVRKAAYGMKPDQLSKYLVNLKKINIGGSRTGKSMNVGNLISVRGVTKPKIYSKNQFDKYIGPKDCIHDRGHACEVVDVKLKDRTNPALCAVFFKVDCGCNTKRDCSTNSYCA